MFKNKQFSRLLKLAPLGLVAATLMMTAPVSASAGDIAAWQKSVVSLISKKQVYPRAALDNSIEGKAKVKVTIDRTGAVTNFQIIQSTGNSILDAEVPKLMSRINPLPAPPADMSNDQLTFVLPLSWALE